MVRGRGEAVGSEKKRQLEMTVATIQGRFGLKALQRLESAGISVAEVPHIPTGFVDLDKVLGSGGMPRGRITELLGAPTSGMSTLALKVIANAQFSGDTAVYVDLSGTFDPGYAARCSIDLKRLLLVRPRQGTEALEIAGSLGSRGGIGILVFDSVPHLLSEPTVPRTMAVALRRLSGALIGSACAFLFLTPLFFSNADSPNNYPAGFDLPRHAAARLLIERERWLQKRSDITGYQARASVLKNAFGPAGKRATIAITFDDVVQGSGK
jgi:recombination protein RecA